MNPESADLQLPRRTPEASTHELLTHRALALSHQFKHRSHQNLLPYDRRLLEGPKPFSSVRERNGAVFEGLNFASSDYLGLSTHPLVKQAAASATHRLGSNSAGSAALAGMTDSSDLLARRLGSLVQLPQVALFSSGWAAGYGTLRALVKPGDAVVMDACISSGVRCGASASTRRLLTYRHLDTDHAHRCLRHLRATQTRQAAFLVTCGLFPVDGSSADLSSLHQLCLEFDAYLVVDASHDIACTGSGGAGEIEIQSLLGKVPVVIGSLSKTLASNGGFVAVEQPELCDYIRARSPTYLFSSTLSPAQVAAATQALAIVGSPEGAARRAALRRSVIALRAALVQEGLEPGDGLGPIVTVPVGNESVARQSVRCCSELGVLLNLAEYPLVPKAKSQLRLQMMTGHEPSLMPEIAKKIAWAISESRHAESEIPSSRSFERV
ncbi:MAG: pyridoxal phosphate-dependent aminotransferase family protein [Opitutaceae bacterium]|nr:pyridoxal phosphate-dependent aminotransferase family protein [Opitutaceae bacterium]